MTSDELFATTRQTVETEIRSLLDSKIAQAEVISREYAELWRSIGTVIEAGGKRFRPFLTVVGYGQLDERIVPIALSQELLHTAMLMHDDVFDQDFMRRGAPNINGMYREAYRHHVDEPAATHYANSMGVLTGDVLLSELYQLIASADVAPDVRQTLSQQAGRSVFEVIGGEMMDIEASFRRDIAFDPMMIYRYKTAGYSFVGPLVSGAICAGAGEQVVDRLTRFAENLGIAFQVQDDILGLYGDQAKVGKPPLADLREAKRTILIEYHQSLMNDEQATRFEAFGTAVSDAQLEQLRDDIEASGAREKAEQLAEDYLSQARQAAEELRDDARHEHVMYVLESIIGGRQA